MFKRNKQRKNTKSVEQLSVSQSNHSLVPLIIRIMVSIFMGSALFWLIFLSPLFKVQEVTQTTLERYEFLDRATVQGYLEDYLIDKHILLIKTASLEEYLVTLDSRIKSVTIHKKIPDGLEVEIIERKPILILYHQDSGKEYLLDVEGYVLGEKHEEKLTQLIYPQEPNIKETIDDQRIISVLEIIELLNIKDLGTIELRENYGIIVKIGSTELIFSSRKSSFEQVELYRQVTGSQRLLDLHVNTIDLRYDRPVISE